MLLDIQDIINSVSVPTLIKDEFINKGSFAKLKNGDLQACVGGFSIVFPVEVNGSKWAFRCWHHTLDDDQARIKLLSTELKSTGLPYFIDFEYEDKGVVVNGEIYPTTRMKWVNGRDIKDYICYNKNDRHKLFELATNFFVMTQDLHRLSIAHGDLQHENIIVTLHGKIFLIDYDSMYVPALSYMNSKNSTNGKEGYQHPARENCINSNPTLDYFSEVVILTSVLAVAHNPELIDKYDMVNSDTMLFSKADFRDLSSSQIYADLSSLGGIFNALLNVLSSYLGKQDITTLEPLERAIAKDSPMKSIIIEDYLKTAEDNLLKIEEENKRHQKELAAWQSACRLNSSIGFTLYLNNYPNGRYSDIATQRLISCQEAEDWVKAKRLNTIKALNRFISLYPRSSHIVEANAILGGLYETKEWESAQKDNTISSYRNYLNHYPSGKYAVEAIAAKRKIIDVRCARIIGIVAIPLVVGLIGAVLITTFNNSYTSPSKPAIEQTRQLIPQIPQQSISPQDLNDLEKRTERLINAMEITKKDKEPINQGIYKQTEHNLDELKKYGSDRYGPLKSRYDAL